MCYEILSKLKSCLMHCNHILPLSASNWHELSTILFTQVSSSIIYNITNKSINWKLKVRYSRLRPPRRPPLHPHLLESSRARGGVSAAEAGVVPAEAPGPGRRSRTMELDVELSGWVTRHGAGGRAPHPHRPPPVTLLAHRTSSHSRMP
jgi:hypothetical protein